MTRVAGVESVQRSRRRRVLPYAFLALWSALGFAALGAASASLGTLVPDLGVVLLIGLVARGNPATLWTAALAIGLGRVAVGIEPPLAVLAGYTSVAGVHAGLCAIAHGQRAWLRLAATALYAALITSWLVAVHELSAPVPLGLLERVPELALHAAAATVLACAVLSPFLSRVPGLGSWRVRS